MFNWFEHSDQWIIIARSFTEHSPGFDRGFFFIGFQGFHGFRQKVSDHLVCYFVATRLPLEKFPWENKLQRDFFWVTFAWQKFKHTNTNANTSTNTNTSTRSTRRLQRITFAWQRQSRCPTPCQGIYQHHHNCLYHHHSNDNCIIILMIIARKIISKSYLSQGCQGDLTVIGNTLVNPKIFR